MNIRYYRRTELFTVFPAPWPEKRQIEPTEERIEVYYAKFLETGEYNITAIFPYPDWPEYLSSSVIVNVIEAEISRYPLNRL